jgi:hypothetical protein
MQLPDPETVGENALERFARGPFDKFKKEAEFSPVDGIVEEILGRLGLLRRNQQIVDVGPKSIVNSHKFLRDHDMRVLNIAPFGIEESPEGFKNLTTKVNIYDENIDEILYERCISQVALLCADSSTLETSYDSPVVVATVNPSTPPDSDYPRGFKATNAFWKEKGYIPVAMSDKFVVYLKGELATQCEVKGVVLRNADMLFDWKHVH